ncbi:hypothetical protein M8494_17040 [Serratia ureilytica]
MQHDLLQTLFAQSPRKCPIGGLPPQQQWLSTRQLANAVNVGVYGRGGYCWILSPGKSDCDGRLYQQLIEVVSHRVAER